MSGAAALCDFSTKCFANQRLTVFDLCLADAGLSVSSVAGGPAPGRTVLGRIPPDLTFAASHECCKDSHSVPGWLHQHVPARSTAC